MTQLPLNLGKGTDGRVSCPAPLLHPGLAPPCQRRGLVQGPLCPRLWFTHGWTSRQPQNQLIGFPAQFGCPTEWSSAQARGKEGRLPAPPSMALGMPLFLAFISPVSSTGCPTLSPLSTKISSFSDRKSVLQPQSQHLQIALGGKPCFPRLWGFAPHLCCSTHCTVRIICLCTCSLTRLKALERH